MTKNELIQKTAREALMTEKETRKALDVLLRVMKDQLADGGKVVLSGFGTLEVHQTQTHIGHNPATGKMMEVPASKRVVFKTGQTMRDALNV